MFKLTTPTGRIVWGHPCISETKKNMRTGAVVMDKNNQPTQQWAFGLAIPKDQFNAQVWPVLAQIAGAVHGQVVPPDFAWKIKDGDGMDGKGKPYSQRDGYAGCFILTISTEAFCPPLYKWNPQKNDYDRLEPNQIKCGDHVASAVVIKHNGQTAGNGAGLYINPEGIELIAYDKEIVGTGANPQELFANVNRAIPQGASATPVSSAPAGAGMPQQGQPVNNGYVQQPQNNGYPQQGNPNAGYPNGGTGQPAANTGQPGGYAQPVASNATGYPSNGQPVNNGQPAPNHEFVNNAMGQQPSHPSNGYVQQPQNNGFPQNGQPNTAGGFPGNPGPR